MKTIQEFHQAARQIMDENGFNDKPCYVSVVAKSSPNIWKDDRSVIECIINPWIPECIAIMGHSNPESAIEQLRLEIAKRKLDKSQVQNDIEI